MPSAARVSPIVAAEVLSYPNLSNIFFVQAHDCVATALSLKCPATVRRRRAVSVLVPVGSSLRRIGAASRNDSGLV